MFLSFSGTPSSSQLHPQLSFIKCFEFLISSFLGRATLSLSWKITQFPQVLHMKLFHGFGGGKNNNKFRRPHRTRTHHPPPTWIMLKTFNKFVTLITFTWESELHFVERRRRCRRCAQKGERGEIKKRASESFSLFHMKMRLKPPTRHVYTSAAAAADERSWKKAHLSSYKNTTTGTHKKRVSCRSGVEAAADMPSRG